MIHNIRTQIDNNDDEISHNNESKRKKREATPAVRIDYRSKWTADLLTTDIPS